MIYSRPTSMDELQDLLRTSTEPIHFLAGGTDLMPRWNRGGPLPAHLVDLKAIDLLSGISESAEGITFGALTTVEALRQSPVIRKRYPALAQAADQFAGLQIRHRGTIGGNLCNASPAADLVPPLVIYGAQVDLAGPNGSRSLPLEKFITGPGKTALKTHELLTAIRLPLPAGESFFHKVGLRQSMAISVVNLAGLVEHSSSNGTRFRFAAGAVAPTVVPLARFTSALESGQPLEVALEQVDADIAPIDDIRATAQYRRKCLKNLLSHIVKEFHV